MAKAIFTGVSEKKITNKENSITGDFKDLQIRIESVKEFPLRVSVENPTYGWQWRWPWTNRCWDMVVSPVNGTTYNLFFALPHDSLHRYPKFLEENSPPFEVTIVYQDETDEQMTTIDGRIPLTRPFVVNYLKEKLPEWPDAAPAEAICQETENDKLERAELILEDLFQSKDYFKNMKFLDFGCGDGHLVKLVAETASVAVGYDVVMPALSGDEKFSLTTDFDLVRRYAPYDAITLYDVLDHTNDMEQTMYQIKQVCKPNTIIVCRCHPWSGRHGGHLYNKINKAFIHRLFTDDELKQMGYEAPKIQKVIDPLTTYKGIFQKTGFRITENYISWDELEPIFSEDAVFKRQFDMIESARITYVDYTLAVRP